MEKIIGLIIVAYIVICYFLPDIGEGEDPDRDDTPFY